MESEIIILSGPVHTGKSTALHRWVQHQKTHENKVICGLLNPEIDGAKRFIDIRNGQFFKMDSTGNEDSISIGKYRFSASAFQRARNVLLTSAQVKSDILIIDEIGKLELKNEGLEPAVSSVLKRADGQSFKTLILVIRDWLLEEAVLNYGLKNYKLVNKDYFEID